MGEELSKRVDDFSQARKDCEDRAEVWRKNHIENHRIDEQKSVTSKHFIYGVVFVSVFQTGVSVVLHLIG